jgi:SAM-dependent methyltransferase/uncharacterized protein YbaR (Trm112 family)
MLDKRLLDLIVCPRDRDPLTHRADQLSCPQGHIYPIVDDVPILLVREMRQTHIEGERSLAVAEAGAAADLPKFEVRSDQIDPFVNRSIGATNGSLYQHLVGNLREYPIPDLRLPSGEGKSFLEIGCNWGRWCIAAARLGYCSVGIDPSLKSIRAARRVAQQLGITAHYAVADGRCMPFPDRAFDQAFSYSVLQHLSRDNVRSVLSEVRRVLHPNGGYQLQMPNAFGIRCLYHQARRHFRDGRDFEVRYWTPRKLASVFSEALGSAQLSVDGYFSLNAQISDLRFLPPKYRVLVRVSDRLRKLSRVFPPLLYAADSLYVTAA